MIKNKTKQICQGSFSLKEKGGGLCEDKAKIMTNLITIGVLAAGGYTYIDSGQWEAVGPRQLQQPWTNRIRFSNWRKFPQFRGSLLGIQANLPPSGLSMDCPFTPAEHLPSALLAVLRGLWSSLFVQCPGIPLRTGCLSWLQWFLACHFTSHHSNPVLCSIAPIVRWSVNSLRASKTVVLILWVMTPLGSNDTFMEVA